VKLVACHRRDRDTITAARQADDNFRFATISAHDNLLSNVDSFFETAVMFSFGVTYTSAGTSCQSPTRRLIVRRTSTPTPAREAESSSKHFRGTGIKTQGLSLVIDCATVPSGF